MVEKNKEKEIINKQLETAGESSNQALSLTARMDSLLQLVPSEKQLSNDNKIRDYFLELKRKKDKENEESKRRLEEDKKYDEIRAIKRPISFKSLFSSDDYNQKEWKEWMGVERTREREEWNNQQTILLLQFLFRPKYYTINEQFNKVKELALSENNNQGEVKIFVETVGKELLNIKEEMENREDQQIAIKENLLKEIDKKEAEIAILENLLDGHKAKEQERKERIIDRLKKGQTIKSQEAVTIEELKRENEILTEEIEQLEIDRDDLLSLKSGYDLEIKELEGKLEAKNKDIKELHEYQLKIRADKDEKHQKVLTLRNEKQAERNKNILLEEEKKERDRKFNELEAKKQELEQAKNQLTNERNELQEQLTKQTRQKRLGNLFAAASFVNRKLLPLPKKWENIVDAGINTAQAWQIVKDLPNSTYEIIIGLGGVLVFLGARGIYYRIINRKEINKLQELQGELLEMRSKYLILKGEKN